MIRRNETLVKQSYALEGNQEVFAFTVEMTWRVQIKPTQIAISAVSTAEK